MLPRRPPATIRRTSVRPKPLEPLSSRRARLKLLLSSYLDAAVEADEGDVDEAHGGQSEARAPMRNLDLWLRGSYPRVERCLDALRARWPLVYRAVWAAYVLRWPVEGEAARRAEFGLYLMLEELGPFIYVPAVISENAGHLPGEAKEYERRRHG